MGQPYQESTKRSEAERYVREALLVSPYIREVQVTGVDFEGSTMHIAVDMTTVYGRAGIYHGGIALRPRCGLLWMAKSDHKRGGITYEAARASGFLQDGDVSEAGPPI